MIKNSLKKQFEALFVHFTQYISLKCVNIVKPCTETHCDINCKDSTAAIPMMLQKSWQNQSVHLFTLVMTCFFLEQDLLLKHYMLKKLKSHIGTKLTLKQKQK